MTHDSAQDMMFYLLKRIDYTQTWEKIEYGLGYDLGDYSFTDRSYYDKTRLCAFQIWSVLNEKTPINQLIKQS
jgi:hypothetical protein